MIIRAARSQQVDDSWLTQYESLVDFLQKFVCNNIAPLLLISTGYPVVYAVRQ
jgi:hypothetical protein